MNKDVIYIDVEDDITAIIGKVKGAKEKIVALVPPKRIGVLQSAVNLRLLARAATQADKRLVLITNNSALGALAAAAQVPVAKNLQSKPEMAEISALEVDNGEDVIDGSQLPVGELAKTADPSALGAAALMDDDSPAPKATPPAPGQAPKKPKAKSGAKVPNFNKFRKKIVFLAIGGVLLVAFLVWAIFFAPRATVVITARTTDSSANAQVSFASTLGTDLADNTLKAVTESIKKESSVEFDATGTKEVGEKAKGQVVFENCEEQSAITIPAGTAIAAGGKNYLTQSTVRVPGGSGGFGGCTSPGESDPVSVVAMDIGGDYNTPRGTRFSVAGHPSGGASVYFRATATSSIRGGSKKEVKVVTTEDVLKAKQQMADQSTDGMKADLKKKFDEKTTLVLDATFDVGFGDVATSPDVGQEASNGKAKISSEVTYSLTGLEKSEINNFLDDYFKDQLKDVNDRRVYENGASDASLTDVNKDGDVFRGNLTATAKIGPKIEDDKVKGIAKGKRYGEIQSQIEKIQGVDDVDIKFWPFWVSQAPNDTKKINVNFNLDEQE